MKKVLIFFTICQLSLLVNSQNNFESDSTNLYVFGARIVPTDYGIGEYYIIYKTTNNLSIIEKINYEDFVSQVMGKQKSVANETNKNLLDYYAIKDYHVMAQLWRLRYAVYPFTMRSQDTLGWTKNFANPFMPNTEQMKILQTYGIKSINEIIFGDNLFRLFKDMENRDWVMNYVNAGNPK